MKRLTKQQTEDRIVSKIIHRIMNLEKQYSAKLVERACFKYKLAMMNQRRALSKKEKLEEELAQIKKRLK